MAFKVIPLCISLLLSLVIASPTPTADSELDTRALGPNLVQNPGFESTGGWTYLYGAVRKTGPAAASGTGFAEIASQGTDMNGAFQQSLYFNTTATYTFEFQYAAAKNLQPGHLQDCSISAGAGYVYSTIYLTNAQDHSYKNFSTVIQIEGLQGYPKKVEFSLACSERPALVVHFDNVALYKGTRG